MRFAGNPDVIDILSQEQEPAAVTIGGDDVDYGPLDDRPVFDQGPDGTSLDIRKLKYMGTPEGGVTRLPNFEQGPDQGPSTPLQYYPQGGNRGFFGPDGNELRGRTVPVQQAQMAPSMMDGYVDNQGLGPDTGLPYIVGPELQRQRRDSMQQFQSVPAPLLPKNLRGV